MKIVFGPVNSRRFGRSLGVDLSPGVKQCNFDCVYCELAAAKPVLAQSKVPKISDIIDEIRAAIAKNADFDFITLTANGEPSLYPHLNELVNALNSIKGDKKLLILSNGSAVLSPNFHALLGLDVVKFSLDSAISRTFFKIDRAHKSVNLGQIITKMAEFRTEFKGVLVMESLVVQGFNDNEAEFIALNEAFLRIKPDRIDISTIDRPSAYPVKPVSEKTLESLAKLITAAPVFIARRQNSVNLGENLSKNLDENLVNSNENSSENLVNSSKNLDKNLANLSKNLDENSANLSKNSVNLNKKNGTAKNENSTLLDKNLEQKNLDLNEDEILKMLSLRPQSEFDILNFSENSRQILNKLLKNGKIRVQNLAGMSFYRV